MRLFAREIPPADGVVDESSHAARSEMLEFHLLHIYAGDADFLVALDDDSVISLVVKSAVPLISYISTRGVTPVAGLRFILRGWATTINRQLF